MSLGLKFITAAIESQAGNAILRLDPILLVGEQEMAVYEFCRDYYRRHRESPSTELVRESLNIRLPRINAPADFYENELEDRYNFEICRTAFTEMRGAISSTEPGPLIESMQNAVRCIRRTRRADQGLIDIGEAMELSINRLEQMQGSGGMSGVPTPWPSFNLITSGYQPSDLITWVGRTSLGKTMLLLAQCEYAYDAGYSVLFVTTEMRSEAIARRWMAMKFGYDPNALKSAQVSTYVLRRMRSQHTELLGRERFRMLSIGLNSDMGLIEAAIEEMQPDALYLDGAYLLKPTGQKVSRSKTEQVSAVFDEVKQRNIDTNIPWIVNTQFSRQSGKGGREGSLETIGLSDTIGQHSSIVVGIKPGPTENWHHSRELDLLKGREGEQGRVFINYKHKPTNFSEMTEAELAECDAGSSMGDDGEMYN